MEPLPASSGPVAPLHVAIIMDGNGRWAKARGLPRAIGHQRGAEAARRTVQGAAELGIGYLTLFGFSSENWSRPTAEIDDLMQLLRFYLEREIEELHRNGIRLSVIGDRQRLSPAIVRLIENAEAMTNANARMRLIMALSYGGRAEITAATLAVLAALSGGLASDQKIIVTPENALFGKVALVNPTARFVVLNFPVGHLPVTEQHLNLYHRGLKVGEVRVTGPQQDDNIVADLVTGDASVGDDVRDK